MTRPWWLLFSIVFVPVAALNRLYMYDTEYPPVLEYKVGVNDFEKATAPRIVEFYSPTCGGCQRFKARYLELVKEMGDLRPDVEFYGVSCNAHRDLCNRYNIRSMPSLMAFHNGKEDGVLLPRSMKEKGGYGVRTLMEGLGDSMEDTVKTKDEETGAALRQLDKSQQGFADDDDDDAVDTGRDEAHETENDNDEQLAGEVSGPDHKINPPDSPEEEEEEEVVRVVEEEEEGRVDPDEDNDEKTDVEPSNGGELASDGEEIDAISNHDHAQEDEHDEGIDDDESSNAKDDDDDDEYDAAAVQVFDRTRPLFTGSTKNTPPQPVAYKNVNEWKTYFAEKRTEAAAERKYAKFLKQHDKNAAQDKVFVPGAAATVKGSTEIMLANTPGTPEYERRKQELKENISKLVNANNLRQDKPQEALLTNVNNHVVKKLKKESIVHKSIKRVPVVKRLAKVTQEEELYWDACQSLMHGLRYNVFSSRLPLMVKHRQALKSWLEILSVTLPPEWAIHELVDELISNFPVISMSRENLLNVLEKHKLPRKGWSPSCSHGMLGRGMNCGFWKLLHIVSIGMAEHRGGTHLIEARQQEDDDTRIFSPREAALTIREYMAFFYGNCESCRDYFLATYDECQFRACTRLTSKATSSDPVEWKQLALWIWAIHNDVSVTVANKNNNGDSKHILSSVKALWPSIKTCIICFEEDGSWDEDAVFEHLEETYWSLSLDPKTDRLLTRKSSRFGDLLYMMTVMAVALVALTRRRVTNVSPFHVLKHTSTFRGAKVRKV